MGNEIYHQRQFEILRGSNAIMSQLPLVLNFFLSTRGDDESLAPGRIMSLAPGAPTHARESLVGT